MPHLYRVIVPVADIDKGQVFYEAVLGITGTRVSPERHYFDCEGTILALYDPVRFNEHRFRANPENIYLAVDDLRVQLDRALAAGAELTADIEAKPWGETSFYVLDPFGNEICFVDRKTVFTGE